MPHIAEKDRDLIVENLKTYGIRFLASGETEDEARIHLSAEDLIGCLAESTDPRLRLALIPFFIRHPRNASRVLHLVERLNEPAKTELMTFYMAAVYLQRFWKPRLQLYLSDFPLLPDLYSQEFSLPEAEDRHGKNGLYALADWHANRSPYLFNWLASYHKVMDLLFEQLKMEEHDELARISQSPAN